MEVRRLAILGAVVVVLLGGGIWLLFVRGGDDAPTVEAGSRFGEDRGSRSGGTLMDTLAPLIAASQEGGDFSAFRNLAPPAQVDVGNARKGTRDAALGAGRQLRALGVAMTLAPNADIAVAGGPGQGRAFSDRQERVTSAVK